MIIGLNATLERVIVPSIQMMHGIGSKVGHLIYHHCQKIYRTELS